MSALVDLSFLRLCLESEIFLRQIAEGYDDNGGERFGDRGIDMELLYEELDEDIVEQQADDHQDEVSEQLYPAVQGRFGEDDVPCQEKAEGKADAERDQDRCDMGLDHQESQIHVVLVKNNVIGDGIHDNVDNSVGPPACGIAESLQWHYPAERRVKKIDKRNDAIFQYLCHAAENGANILPNGRFCVKK